MSLSKKVIKNNLYDNKMIILQFFQGISIYQLLQMIKCNYQIILKPMIIRVSL
jgi:hypothetical protein